MRRRQAFTLVEMMVSTALVLFVMLLLSQAFIAGAEAFRQLKSIGEIWSWNDNFRLKFANEMRDYIQTRNALEEGPKVGGGKPGAACCWRPWP